MTQSRPSLSFPLLVLFALFFFSIPLATRFMMGNPTLPGEYPYHYITPSSHSFFSSPFHFVASSAPLSLFSYGIILIIGGTLLFVLFYALLRIHFPDRFFLTVTSLLFIFSPTTTYLASFFSPYLFALLFLLSGLLLLHSRFPFLSLLPFSFLLFFDWLAFISSFIIIFCTILLIRHKNQASLPLLFAGLSFIISFFYSRPLAFEVFPFSTPFLNIFSDFGALHGLSFFVFLLSITGMFLQLRRDTSFVPVYLALCSFVLLFAFMSIHALLFFTPILIIFASFGFVRFWDRSWVLFPIRTLTLLALTYGVLFSSFSYTHSITQLSPSPAIFDSLHWLQTYASPGSAVLSHPEKGFWISYGSHLTPFVTYLTPDYPARFSSAETLFHSRDLKKTMALFEYSSIFYIFIDRDMKSGQVWREPDEGLLFLFRNERFKKVYDQEGIEIWKFIPR